MLLAEKIFEFRNDAKDPQFNSGFMNKIGGIPSKFSNLDSSNITLSPIRNSKIEKPKTYN